ncbi:MAG: metallophosphoesterase [Deltaproteobacteria bacterium]|nr:metallophosphoesterase [Deltaproteobacteria bacterium]
MRRIFIGDIQGCSEALDRLLEAIDAAPADRLICVGDVVNRGPDSLGVLRRLADLDAEVVLGNHDLLLLEIARGLRTVPPDSPLQPVLDAADGTLLIDWLAHHPVVLTETDLVVVHAGLHPYWFDIMAIGREINEAMADLTSCFADQRIKFATRVRYCDAQGHRPERDDPPPGEPFRPWDEFYNGERTVVFGHWARRGLVRQPRRRGLDTGCVYGGALTAWVAEEDRFVQVEGQKAVTS